LNASNPTRKALTSRGDLRDQAADNRQRERRCEQDKGACCVATRRGVLDMSNACSYERHSNPISSTSLAF
jgi:hypothetical protein